MSRRKHRFVSRPIQSSKNKNPRRFRTLTTGTNSCKQRRETTQPRKRERDKKKNQITTTIRGRRKKTCMAKNTSKEQKTPKLPLPKPWTRPEIAQTNEQREEDAKQVDRERKQHRRRYKRPKYGHELSKWREFEACPHEYVDPGHNFGHRKQSDRKQGKEEREGERERRRAGKKRWERAQHVAFQNSKRRSTGGSAIQGAVLRTCPMGTHSWILVF